jgi:peroxiredoxin
MGLPVITIYDWQVFKNKDSSNHEEIKMINQIKNKKVLLVVLGILTISVVVVFGIIQNQPISPEKEKDANLDDIIKSRKTWNTSFTSWAGKKAPDFLLNDIEGNQHRLSDYKGKNVMLVFWATWCPACNMEIPHLIELRKIYGEEKLAILAISNESTELLKQFAAEKGINYKLLSPGNKLLPAPFADVQAIPTTFFIDRKGAIKLAAEGLVSLEESKAILEIN